MGENPRGQEDEQAWQFEESMKEMGAAAVETRFQNDGWYCLVTYEDGHQVRGTGGTRLAAMRNARQAMNVDKGMREGNE